MTTKRSTVITTNTHELKMGKQMCKSKRLIRLDERNFLRGLEQGWGGVGLRTDLDIDKKKSILCLCGVQEVWKKTDFIIKFINISFKAYTSTWINKKPIDTGFEYIRYLRSRFFFPRRSCLWIHGRQDDQKTRDAFIWLIYIHKYAVERDAVSKFLQSFSIITWLPSQLGKPLCGLKFGLKHSRGQKWILKDNIFNS